jgi:hypothetical protein
MTFFEYLLAFVVLFSSMIAVSLMIAITFPVKKLDIYKKTRERFQYFKGLKVMTKKDIQELKEKVINHDI